MNPYRLLLTSQNFGAGEIIETIAIVLLLVLSSFFSASETAFSSVNATHIRAYADEKRKGARRAKYVLDHFDMALVSFLVGNNLVNIANATICASLFAKLITNPTLSNILNTVVMTIIILIFGEIMPKSYAKHHPEK